MNVKHYLKKKSIVSKTAWLLPCIATALAVVDGIILLLAVLSNNIALFYFAIMFCLISLSIAFPVCGGFGLASAIKNLRKNGRQTKIILFIVWNAICLLLTVPAVYFLISVL